MSTLSQDINSGLESHPESPIALPITFPGIDYRFIPDMDSIHLSDDDDEPEESESTITMAKNIFWEIAQEMNLVCAGLLILKESNTKEGALGLRSKSHQGRSDLGSFRTPEHLRRMKDALQCGAATASPLIFQYILHRAMAMIDGEVSLREREFGPIQFHSNAEIPALKSLLHTVYTLEMKSLKSESNSAGGTQSASSVNVFKAKKAYNVVFQLWETEVEQVACEVYGILEQQGQRAARAILTDGFYWMFLLVRRNENGDGGTYICGTASESIPVKMLAERRNSFETEFDEDFADWIGAIVASWVMHSGSEEIGDDDWFSSQIFSVAADRYH